MLRASFLPSLFLRRSPVERSRVVTGQSLDQALLPRCGSFGCGRPFRQPRNETQRRTYEIPTPLWPASPGTEPNEGNRFESYRACPGLLFEQRFWLARHAPVSAWPLPENTSQPRSEPPFAWSVLAKERRLLPPTL